MKCTCCNKTFAWGEKAVRAYYFDKTLQFCSEKCYFEYSKKLPSSYEDWMREYKRLSLKQTEQYRQNLKKVENQVSILEKKI
ncbi:MAG: hypothetical protein ABIA56_05235 [Actinomycetota bacterium]